MTEENKQPRLLVSFPGNEDVPPFEKIEFVAMEELVLADGSKILLTADDLAWRDDPDAQVVARGHWKEHMSNSEWKAMWDAHMNVIRKMEERKKNGQQPYASANLRNIHGGCRFAALDRE